MKEIYKYYKYILNVQFKWRDCQYVVNQFKEQDIDVKINGKEK